LWTPRAITTPPAHHKGKRYEHLSDYYHNTLRQRLTHIGFALELVQADAIARWHRQKSDDVKFLTSTDENAIKNVLVAKEQGLTPRELCNQIAGPSRQCFSASDLKRHIHQNVIRDTLSGSAKLLEDVRLGHRQKELHREILRWL
jgi:hypothetical protein